MTPAIRSGRPLAMLPLLVALILPTVVAAGEEAGPPAPPSGETTTPAPAAKPAPAATPGGGAAAAPADSSVEEILVSGTSVSDAVDQARFSESIVDVLNADDFAATGDSSVVQALSRVTGVTTVGDKYVYVRGLGERYSSTLFNGALLPSPDPVRRVLPLDLFPSSTMDQLAVQKTWSANLPAEFSGGSVQLKTRAVPEEREFKLSVSMKTNTETTGKETAWMNGGGADWTGFDDGFRAMPAGLRDIEQNKPLTSAERQAIGLTLDRTFDVEQKTLPPGYEIKGSYADRWKTPIGRFGFIVGAQGENDWQHTTEKRCSTDGRSGCFDSAGNSLRNNFIRELTVNAIDYSALGSINWSPATSQLVKATLFWTHLTDNRYDQQDPSFSSEAGRFYRYVNTSWEEQQLISAQVSGSHEIERLAGLLLDWGLTFSRATRDVPDSRFYGWFREGEQLYFDESAGNARTWENLTDDAWDANMEGTLPIHFTQSILSTLKVGGKYFNKQRDSQVMRFRYNFEGNDASPISQLPIDQIFADGNIRPDFWVLRNGKLDNDDYTAEETLGAGYVQLDNDLGRYLRLSVGGRYEKSQQKTITGGIGDNDASIQTDAFYPGVDVTVHLRDDLQLRGAWSQTVNRPDLREIAEVAFYNPDTGFIYEGNRLIDAAEIMNYDLRLEWYHGTGDSVELAGFYKDLTNPIEEVTLPASLNRRSWKNADQATLWGVELAIQQSLAPLGRWADDFTVRTNGAYIVSEVTDDPANAPLATNSKHPLQGQSDWVINFQISHDYLPWDLRNTLAFNVFGKRLSAVGTCPARPDGTCEPNTGDLDEYEQPAPSLDYVMNWGFSLFDQEWNLTLKAKNLLDPNYEWKRGSYTTREYGMGRYFSLDLGYVF